MNLPELIHNAIPTGVSLREWAKRPGIDHGYKSPDAVLCTWASGEGGVPLTKIIKASLLIGCSEQELAMACYGAGSQAEAIAAHKAVQNQKHRASARQKYFENAEHRNAICKRNKQNRAKYYNANNIKRRSLYINPKYREASIARTKAWAQAHPDMRREQARRAKAKRRGARVDYIQGSTLVALIQEANGRCAYCDEERSLTVDHIVPVKQGGMHAITNMVMACRSCNSSKGAKNAIDWIKWKGIEHRTPWCTTLMIASCV